MHQSYHCHVFFRRGRCWSLLCHKHPLGRRHVLSLQNTSLVLFGTDAPNALQLSLRYSPAVSPSLRLVTPHLTSRWDGLFLIWHPERKQYSSAGADTRSAEKRRAENQIVRFGDTLCDFWAVSGERWPRSKVVVLHWHNRFNDGRRHCRPTKDRLRWNCDTFSPTNRIAGGNDAMIKVIDRHIKYTFFFIHVVTVGVRKYQ